MTKDEALRMALKNLKLIEAQDQVCGGNVTEAEAWRSAKRIAWHTINFVEGALAQPEPEPVAWRTFDGEGEYQYRSYENNEDYGDWWSNIHPNHRNWVEPLYTHPKEWVGLTEQEQGVIMEDLNAHGTRLYEFARAIEAKLKERNI